MLLRPTVTLGNLSLSKQTQTLLKLIKIHVYVFNLDQRQRIKV